MYIPTYDPDRHQLLAAAISLTRQINRLEPGPRQVRLRDQLIQLQQQLAALTHPVMTQPLPPHKIPLHVRQCFVQAVLLLPDYQTLGNGLAHYGTWQSRTLSQYQIDPVPTDWSTAAFSTMLMAAFRLTPAIGQTINAQITSCQLAIQQHQRVIGELLNRFDQLKTPADNVALLQALVGDRAVPAAALATVATQTQIIFLLDYAGDQLRDQSLWSCLSDDEKQSLQQFLQQMTDFEFSQFANFPTFGKFTATRLQPDICQALAQTTGVSVPHVARILQQAIGLVPMAKAEAFLVHDICGHGWQQLLTQFGGDYAILALAHQPLKPGLAAYTAEGPIALREVIQRQGDRMSIDPELARCFFHGEVQQRLTCLMAHLIGEMLADFHEFKWLWQNQSQAAHLPSSSAFKTLPAKLDLGILDVEFLFERLLQPLLNFTVDPEVDSLLEQSLLIEWGQFDPITRRQLKRSLLQLHHIFWEEYLAHYQPTAAHPSHRFGQIVSNLLDVQNISNHLYCSDWSETGLPFQDLLAVFIGCYCSADAYQHFWQIDQVLAQYFIPCWQILAAQSTPRSD